MNQDTVDANTVKKTCTSDLHRFRLQVSNIDERRKDQDGLDDLVKDPDANVNIRNAVRRGFFYSMHLLSNIILSFTN